MSFIATNLSRACFVHLQTAIVQYLLANTAERLSGYAKAMHHRAMVNFYVAVVRGGESDLAQRHFPDDYKRVHVATQEHLTDFLDEVIGFPLDRSTPDIDVLSVKFFEHFHTIAMATLEGETPELRDGLIAAGLAQLAT